MRTVSTLPTARPLQREDSVHPSNSVFTHPTACSPFQQHACYQQVTDAAPDAASPTPRRITTSWPQELNAQPLHSAVCVSWEQSRHCGKADGGRRGGPLSLQTVSSGYPPTHTPTQEATSHGVREHPDVGSLFYQFSDVIPTGARHPAATPEAFSATTPSCGGWDKGSGFALTAGRIRYFTG